MYSISGESSPGWKNGARAGLLVGLLEVAVADRQVEPVAELLEVAGVSFFIWWVAFLPSSASIVQPLMVWARITVGWPTCLVAASKAAYTLR